VQESNKRIKPRRGQRRHAIVLHQRI
jgi:hypothetical protein